MDINTEITNQSWGAMTDELAKKIENPNKSNNSNENWSMSKINSETGGW